MNSENHSPIKLNSGGLPAAAWFTPARFALILALFAMVAFPDVVFGWRTFYFRDFSYFGYPVAYYHRESFWRGELPLWNPLSNGGLPFLAQWNTLALYPGALIYLLFPLSWSLGVYCLVHQFFGGLGMYYLARSWVGNPLASAIAGLAFAFNGLTLNCLMWPNNIAGLAWMPWVVRAADQACSLGGRNLFLAGLIAAIQMLTGAPEIILLTWIILVPLTVFKSLADRRLSWKLPARFGLIAALAASLAAAQLLPFFDLLAHSHRDYGYGDSAWAMPAWGWANLFVPLFGYFRGFHGVYAQHQQYWTSSYYLGVGVLVLGLWAAWKIRRVTVWVLAGLAAISLILAMGDAGFLFLGLRRVLPAIGFMRYPIKFVVILVFVFPLLAAYAAARYFENDPDPRTIRRGLFLWILSLGLIAAILAAAYCFPLPLEQWPVTWRSGTSRALFLTLIASLLGALRYVQRRPTQLLLALGLLLLMGLDVLTHMPPQNPTLTRAAFEPRTVRLSPQPALGYARAMVSPAANSRLRNFASSNPLNDYICTRFGLFANGNLLDGLPKIDGFFSLYLRHTENVRALLYSTTNPAPHLAPLYDFLAVAQITAPDEFCEWSFRPSFHRFASAGQKPLFADDNRSLAGISRADFDPAQIVYLPLEAQLALSLTNPAPAQITEERFEPHRIELRVQAEQPSLLVIAQSFYHCWSAFVDSQPVPLWRANHAFQAVAIPRGQHQILLRYQDRAFFYGSMISLAALAATLAGWSWPRSPLSHRLHEP